MGVSADDDGLHPAGDQARDVFADDGFSEHGPAQDVPDGSVGRPPHLLQFELLHTVLIRCDGGTLDAYVVAADRLRGLHCHLVVGGISVLNAQVIAARGKRNEQRK